ncbi:DNAase [Priestia megaterium]|uniref:TatD family hydrolase n=1 Tax=Priestia megaterium TaxID=1404 RepID=UPI00068273B4|nr:TatD family hydrolase [Priestia megaterium]KNH15679.1 DNAase [Priestia megaterium]
MKRIIDSHIHLDQYEPKIWKDIIEQDPSLQALISVSSTLQSCQLNQKIGQLYSCVKPAYGFHPEQMLPSSNELAELFAWIDQNNEEMIAVGEVGLPYYLSQTYTLSLEPYLELLEAFIVHSKKWGKPLILHAVYEDAEIVCDLLEKHSVSKAHFHWFKGTKKTVERMKNNGYYISVTPDIVYKPKIQALAMEYPLDYLMVETDGPWPFEGPFQNHTTVPSMIHQSVEEIARLKGVSVTEAYDFLYQNTSCFYSLST